MRPGLNRPNVYFGPKSSGALYSSNSRVAIGSGCVRPELRVHAANSLSEHSEKLLIFFCSFLACFAQRDEVVGACIVHGIIRRAQIGIDSNVLIRMPDRVIDLP